MTRGRRLAIVGAVVVLAVVGFVIAQSGGSNKDKSTTTTPLKPGPDTTASIPTLSQWGLMLMSSLLALMALGAMRRRERR